ncbi:hypothetical protein KO465_03980 [Candidatus Micrarchaeota archaeon]|jgi:Holliday junction resolvase-like predicted endonuclease|nr:hypothetical protein [Candidatus Micrarchaeota archaeon]
MSSRSKGSKHEREAKQELEEQGWIAFKPQKTSRFGTQDIFNMFDLVAVKENQLKFIQIKTGSTAGFLKKLKKWSAEHSILGVSWELWVRKDARLSKTTDKWNKYIY